MTGPMFLVTGCGRSGTAWAARLFTALGYPCGHERQYTPWRSGPLAAPESSWLAVPHLDALGPGARVVRLIRDPYAVVASTMARGFLADLTDPYAAYVAEHRPDITAPGDHLGRAIRWAALWDTPLDDARHAVIAVDAATLAATAGAVAYATGASPGTAALADVLHKLGSRINAGPRSGDVRAAVDAHPDGRLIADRAERWGYA